MERFDTHLCLVSDQAVPNLLPVLDEHSRPRRVVLAASREMQLKADWLQRVIKGRCPGTTVEILDLQDAYDYDALTGCFIDFLHKQGTRQVALNVTGGTKMMAVAAQEVFRADMRPVFYVNVATDEVIHVGRTGRSAPLRSAMRVRDLLECHGYAVEQAQHPALTARRRDLCARLVDHVRSDGIGLGELNRLAASEAARRDGSVRLSDRDRDSLSLARVIDLFADTEVLSRQRDAIRFADEAARQFANGGWLEAHVHQVMQKLRGANPVITDVAVNVRFTHPDGRTRNELDVACLIGNRLHIVECKTANLAQEGAGGDDKATEAIYKMEAMLKIGGLRTRGMIVDYRGALSKNAANRDRAKGAGIAVAAAEQLRDLEGFIRRTWL
jgi:hypothetical protein